MTRHRRFWLQGGESDLDLRPTDLTGSSFINHLEERIAALEQPDGDRSNSLSASNVDQEDDGNATQSGTITSILCVERH